MKILRLVAEVELSDRDALTLIKDRKLVWDLDKPIATVCDRDVKFVSAVLVDSVFEDQKMYGEK